MLWVSSLFYHMLIGYTCKMMVRDIYIQQHSGHCKLGGCSLFLLHQVSSNCKYPCVFHRDLYL